MCVLLKYFMRANLPRISLAMDQAGVETELFAMPWFITLMLHLKSPKHSSINCKLNRRNSFEMKVLDFLCLDGIKALIKVPICALMNLDNSSKLD